MTCWFTQARFLHMATIKINSWLVGYLSNRTPQVHIGTQDGPCNACTCGVPHGSVLTIRTNLVQHIHARHTSGSWSRAHSTVCGWYWLVLQPRAAYWMLWGAYPGSTCSGWLARGSQHRHEREEMRHFFQSSPQFVLPKFHSGKWNSETCGILRNYKGNVLIWIQVL